MKISTSKIILKVTDSIISIFLCLILMFPVLWILVTSFKPEPRIIEWPPKWFIPGMTIKNYLGVLREYDFLYWLRNSIIVSICATGLTILLVL